MTDELTFALGQLLKNVVREVAGDLVAELKASVIINRRRHLLRMDSC